MSDDTFLTAVSIIAHMESLRDEHEAAGLQRFFKTGKGEYGEGDRFLGLRTPATRDIVKRCRRLPLNEVPALLTNEWHEIRLCGLLILVDRFERNAIPRLRDNEAATRQRDDVVTLYLAHAHRANNWDLVDLSAPKILGHWALLPTFLGGREGEPPAVRREYKLAVLDRLADSDSLWEQRISIVSTWKTSQQGDADFCLRYAERLLHHTHDLMHKAVGWMLREMGKRVDERLLIDFLDRHHHDMPRTTLRYAIERLPEPERHRLMQR